MANCFFIGHRDAPEAIRPRLAEAVERHIAEYGVTTFVVGHYGAFDRMAAAAVRNAKKRHPEVTLTLLLSYYPYRDWEEVASAYDGSLYPEGLETVPKPFAIVRANRYMIGRSDFLICYNRGFAGNTQKIVDMALRREARGQMRVVNLAAATEPSAPVRFGLGKVILTDPADFDRWDAEIADMFEEAQP